MKPNLALLSVLLDKAVFNKVAGGLQSQLIKILSADANPPPLLLAGPDPPSMAHDYIDARAVLLPATISLLAAQGYYAQAAALCKYHTHVHPSFSSFESGLPLLFPYLKSHLEVVTVDIAAYGQFPFSWPLPQTLQRVYKSLERMLAFSIERMQADKYDHLV